MHYAPAEVSPGLSQSEIRFEVSRLSEMNYQVAANFGQARGLILRAAVHKQG